MRHLLLVLLLVAIGQFSQPMMNAQDKTPKLDDIKAKMLQDLKTAGLKDAQSVETENLILFSNLPEAKAKVQIEHLEKLYATAAKGLALKASEKPTTKISILAFPDPDAYKTYVRSVLKRPAGDELSAIDLKATIPVAAVSARRNDKDPKFHELLGEDLVFSLLDRKGGNARLPSWMKNGFYRAVVVRADPKIQAPERAVARKYVGRPLPKNSNAPTVLQNAWMTSKDGSAIAMSMMDWLTFGTGIDKLEVILGLLVPPEGRDEARTLPEALQANEMKLEEFDRPWREWVLKNSPVREEKKK